MLHSLNHKNLTKVYFADQNLRSKNRGHIHAQIVSWYTGSENLILEFITFFIYCAMYIYEQ